MNRCVCLLERSTIGISTQFQEVSDLIGLDVRAVADEEQRFSRIGAEGAPLYIVKNLHRALVIHPKGSGRRRSSQMLPTGRKLVSETVQVAIFSFAVDKLRIYLVGSKTAILLKIHNFRVTRGWQECSCNQQSYDLVLSKMWSHVFYFVFM